MGLCSWLWHVNTIIIQRGQCENSEKFVDVCECVWMALAHSGWCGNIGSSNKLWEALAAIHMFSSPSPPQTFSSPTQFTRPLVRPFAIPETMSSYFINANQSSSSPPSPFAPLPPRVPSVRPFFGIAKFVLDFPNPVGISLEFCFNWRYRRQSPAACHLSNTGVYIRSRVFARFFWKIAFLAEAFGRLGDAAVLAWHIITHCTIMGHV